MRQITRRVTVMVNGRLAATIAVPAAASPDAVAAHAARIPAVAAAIGERGVRWAIRSAGGRIVNIVTGPAVRASA